MSYLSYQENQIWLEVMAYPPRQLHFPVSLVTKDSHEGFQTTEMQQKLLWQTPGKVCWQRADSQSVLCVLCDPRIERDEGILSLCAGPLLNAWLQCHVVEQHMIITSCYSWLLPARGKYLNGGREPLWRVLSRDSHSHTDHVISLIKFFLFPPSSPLFWHSVTIYYSWNLWSFCLSTPKICITKPNSNTTVVAKCHLRERSHVFATNFLLGNIM